MPGLLAALCLCLAFVLCLHCPVAAAGEGVLPGPLNSQTRTQDSTRASTRAVPQVGLRAVLLGQAVSPMTDPSFGRVLPQLPAEAGTPLPRPGAGDPEGAGQAGQSGDSGQSRAPRTKDADGAAPDSEAAPAGAIAPAPAVPPMPSLPPASALPGASRPPEPEEEYKLPDPRKRPLRLFLHVPDTSQTAGLYLDFLDAWQRHYKLRPELVRAAGQGGAKAIGRMLAENSSRGGAAHERLDLAPAQVPAFFAMAMAPNAMYANDELVVVALFAAAHNALWVPEQSPYRSLRDLLEHGRALESEPGKSLLIAGVGSYTEQHLATLMLQRAAGISMRYLPMLGSREATGATKTYGAHACWGYALNPESMPGMRPLAVAGDTRAPLLPQTPTFAEAGTPLVSGAHFGLCIPGRLDGKNSADANQPGYMREAREQARKQRAEDFKSAVDAILATQELRLALQQRGYYPAASLPVNSVAELALFLDTLRDSFTRLGEEYEIFPGR
ncbi:hypothetical protein LJC59_09480 [Desulfovibrio sp. OttesenSCG-928-A18]|nr:hypothetical protein [Desulfovibrio sp. OttesenSCG-928-A18]